MHAMAAVIGDGWRTDPGERLAYAYDNSRREALPDKLGRGAPEGEVVDK